MMTTEIDPAFLKLSLAASNTLQTLKRIAALIPKDDNQVTESISELSEALSAHEFEIVNIGYYTGQDYEYGYDCVYVERDVSIGEELYVIRRVDAK